MNRGRLGTVVVVVASVALVLLVTADLLRPSPAPPTRVATALVRKGTVRVVARAAGTLVPVNQQNASFRQAGQLVEVDVRVGDHVQAGQVLARIDPGPLQDALRQAQARLQQDQSTLDNTVNGNAVQTARHNLDAAQTQLQHTVAETTLAVQEDAATVLQDQRFLANDQTTLRRDQAVLARDQSNLNRDQAHMASDLNALQQDQARLASANAQLAGDQGQLARDQGQQQKDQGQLQHDQQSQQHDCSVAPSGPACAADRQHVSQDNARVNQDQNQINQDQDRVSQDQREVALVQGQVSQDNARLQADQASLSVDTPRVVQDQTLVAQDVQKVQQDQGKLLSDQEKASADQVGGPKEVAAAQAQVTAARDALTQQTTNRATTIAGEQAVVAGDDAAVNNAGQNLSETVLTAPSDGTVASVNGAVGESVTANGGVTTPQAPGSVAPQPNPSGAGTAPAGGIPPASGGPATASAFVVLSDVQSLQVVAMIGEHDAARMEPSQSATVSVDALPGVRLPAAVLAVGPNGTVLQNVTNYLATLVLQQGDHRLKAGMTASAQVVVTELHDVLQIPNAAIEHLGGATYVTVVGSDGTERRTAIQTGQAGDTTTEITAGLRAGDRVLLPQPPPPAQGDLAYAGA